MGAIPQPLSTRGKDTIFTPPNCNYVSECSMEIAASGSVPRDNGSWSFSEITCSSPCYLRQRLEWLQYILYDCVYLTNH